jgi:hypothetical protein
MMLAGPKYSFSYNRSWRVSELLLGHGLNGFTPQSVAAGLALA